MTDGRSIFNQLVKNEEKTYDNIRKITNGQGDGYLTGCLLNYPYFKKHCKMIAIALRKPREHYADPKAIQQIYFTGNLHGTENTIILFIIEESKETILDFSQGTVRVF